MPLHHITGRDGSGEYDEAAIEAPDLTTARTIAADRLAGTGFAMDPLPTTCPVELALRRLRGAYNGVQGATALWESYDELCRDPDPSRQWLAQRDQYARDLANDLQELARAITGVQLALSAMVEGVRQAAE